MKRKFAVFIFCIGVLAVIGFAVVNTGWFVTAVVLPAVAKSLDTNIRVDNADFSVFSGILLENLVIGDSADPVMIGKTLQVDYRFTALLRGRLEVNRVELQDITIHVVADHNGNLNIPGASASENEKGNAKAGSATRSEDLKKISIANVALKNVHISYTQLDAAGEPETSMAISGLSATLDAVAPDAPFAITGTTSVSVKNAENALSVNQVAWNIGGFFGADMIPASISAGATLSDFAGTAGPEVLANRTLKFDLACKRDGCNYNVDTCNIAASLNDTEEATIGISGVYDQKNTAATLTVAVDMANAGLLNLLGSVAGDYTFGNTSLTYHATAVLADTPATVGITGKLAVKDFTVRSAQLGMDPLTPLAVAFEHDLSLDQNTLSLNTLSMSVSEPTKKIVQLNLNESTRIHLHDGGIADAKPADLTLEINDFDLSLLKPLIPPDAGVELRAGYLRSTCNVKIQDAGRTTVLRGDSKLLKLAFHASGCDVENLSVNVTFDAQTDDFFSHATLRDATATLHGDARELLTTHIAGSADLQSLAGEFTIVGKNFGAALLAYGADSCDLDYTFGSTTATYDGTVRISDQGNVATVTGELTAHNASLSSQELGISGLPEVTARCGYGATYDISGSQAKLDQFQLDVSDGDTKLLMMALNEPTMLDLSESSKSKSAIVFNTVVSDITVDRFRSMVPPDLGFQVESGTVEATFDLTVRDFGAAVDSVGTLRVARLTLRPDGAATTAAAVGMNIDSTFDMRYSDDGMIAIRPSSVVATDPAGTLFQFEIEGSLDTTFAGRYSTLAATATAPLQAKRLEDMYATLYPNSDAEEDATEAPSDTENGDDDPFVSVREMNLNLKGRIDIAATVYDTIEITDFHSEYTVQDNHITFDPMTMLVHGGPVVMTGTVRFEDPVPEYQWHITAGPLNLQPLIRGLMPTFTHTSGGTLEKAELSFDGKGIDAESALEHLTAHTVFDVRNINCHGIWEKYGKILALFGLNADVLTFGTAAVTGDVKNKTFEIEKLDLVNAALRVHASGDIAMSGNYAPNLNVTVGYAGKLRSIAEKNKIKLAGEENGYAETQPFRLRVPDWDLTTLMTTWLPDVVDELFELDPTERAILLGAKGLKGVLSGDKGAVKDFISGGLDILNTSKEESRNSAPDSSTESTPDKGKKSDLEKIINIFGRP